MMPSIFPEYRNDPSRASDSTDSASSPPRHMISLMPCSASEPWLSSSLRASAPSRHSLIVPSPPPEIRTSSSWSTSTVGPLATSMQYTYPKCAKFLIEAVSISSTASALGISAHFSSLRRGVDVPPTALESKKRWFLRSGWRAESGGTLRLESPRVAHWMVVFWAPMYNVSCWGE